MSATRTGQPSSSLRLAQPPAVARARPHSTAVATTSDSAQAPLRAGLQSTTAPGDTTLAATAAAGTAASLVLCCAGASAAAANVVGAPAPVSWGDSSASSSTLQQTTTQLSYRHSFSAPAAAAPDLVFSSAQQQQQHLPQQQAQELQQLAAWDAPRGHWLLTVLGIAAANVLGLQAVLKLLQASRDSSTPVTVLTCRMGLRVDNASDNKLQERLRFLRGMLGVDNAAFYSFEEAIQAITQPPRGCQLAYADLQVSQLSSKQAGYDLFKQTAMQEAVRAQQEEAGRVLKGTMPEGPNHRNMLQKLLGAAETQDAESSQACLLVTCVVLSKGSFVLPQQPLRSLRAFKDAMKSLCGHLSLGQLLAVELLMTPDNPSDFLSEAQLVSGYPVLTDLTSGLLVTMPDWTPSPFASVDDGGGDSGGGDSGGDAGAGWGSGRAAEAAAAMAAMAADAAGAEGAASAAAAAAAAAAANGERLA